MAIQRSGRFERVKKPLKSEMNVVPYIDVMLVLLVIFMVTAPQANGNPIESKDAPAMVSLDKDGKYFLKYKDYSNGQALELSELTRILAQAQIEAKAANKQLGVVIQGEKSRSYGEVMALMNSLQDAGLTQVGLLTEPLK